MSVSARSLENDGPAGQSAQERAWELSERMECEAIDEDKNNLLLLNQTILSVSSPVPGTAIFSLIRTRCWCVRKVKATQSPAEGFSPMVSL